MPHKDSKCCPGNLLWQCGPDPQTGLCCQQDEMDCHDRCCPAGTICQGSIVNGESVPTCCSPDVSPCNGGGRDAGWDCDSRDGVHYTRDIPGQPYC